MFIVSCPWSSGVEVCERSSLKLSQSARRRFSRGIVGIMIRGAPEPVFQVPAGTGTGRNFKKVPAGTGTIEQLPFL